MPYTNTSFGNANILSGATLDANVATSPSLRFLPKGPSFTSNQQYESDQSRLNAARRSIQSALESLQSPRRTYTLDVTESDGIPQEDIISRNGRTLTIRNNNYNDEKKVYDNALSSISGIQSIYPSVDAQASAAEKSLMRRGHTARELNQRESLKQALREMVLRQKSELEPAQDEFSEYLSLDQMLKIASGEQQMG